MCWNQCVKITVLKPMCWTLRVDCSEFIIIVSWNMRDCLFNNKFLIYAVLNPIVIFNLSCLIFQMKLLIFFFNIFKLFIPSLIFKLLSQILVYLCWPRSRGQLTLQKGSYWTKRTRAKIKKNAREHERKSRRIKEMGFRKERWEAVCFFLTLAAHIHFLRRRHVE